MKQYGLIGFPLAHSFSEKYFAEKFRKDEIRNVEYLNFPLQNIEELLPLVRNNHDIYGLNVTIPYKEQVIPFLDDLDPLAKEAGAVNTVIIVREKNKISMKGYNTDIIGFIQSLSPDISKHHPYALVLGTGGASKAVVCGLNKLNIKYQLVSRTGKPGCVTYNDVDEKTIRKNTLIINTTPLGMYPDTGSVPYLPYRYMSEKHLLYDLIYNPSVTRFLKEGKKHGAGVMNGLQMLKNQAEESWEIWKKGIVE
ncbi:MAG: shikimate dehydrogenase [Bacteroidetes bacterium]|nr:shikimate dehydrogenase [Bacteroidota bacterium]